MGVSTLLEIGGVSNV
jgi:hypothetical protein